MVAAIRVVALAGCLALAAAGCTATSSTGGQHPVRPPSPVTPFSAPAPSPSAAPGPTEPTALPTAAGAAKVNCPVTPFAGPAPTLTFPASIDGWQLNQGPGSTFETPSYGPGTCNAFATNAVYTDSQQTDAVIIEAGEHANLWTTLSSFWGTYLAPFGTPVPVPAGPLGGQAECALISAQLGWTCTWLDASSFGVFTASGSASTASQAGSEMITFRAAVEKPG